MYCNPIHADPTEAPCLQLKLRKEPSVALRSSSTGQWFPYMLAGGALTIADEGGITSSALLA